MVTMTTYLLDAGALERRRLALGLLRAEVGRRAGVSAISIHRAFTTGNVGVQVARKIATALGLELADLWIDRQGRKLQGERHE